MTDETYPKIFNEDEPFDASEFADKSLLDLAKMCHEGDRIINKLQNRNMGLSDMYHDEAVKVVKRDTRIKELEGALLKSIDSDNEILDEFLDDFGDCKQDTDYQFTDGKLERFKGYLKQKRNETERRVLPLLGGKDE